MPSILVHRAANLKLANYIKKEFKIDIESGNIFDGWIYDLTHSSHGYSVLTPTERINSLIANEFNNINKDFKQGIINHKSIRNLQHLLTDVFSIGQISEEYWGKKDNLIDLASEFVTEKTQWPLFLYQFKTLQEGLNKVTYLINETYQMYSPNVVQWFSKYNNKWYKFLSLPFPTDVKAMIRRDVAFSVIMTASLLRLIFLKLT